MEFDVATVVGDGDPPPVVEGMEQLADLVMPQGDGDDQDEEPEEITVSCSCKLNDGQSCHTRFSSDELAGVRLQFLDLTRSELDIAVLAKLSCGIHLSSLTSSSRKGQQKERKAHRTDFYHHGYRVCREVFRYLHALSFNVIMINLHCIHMDNEKLFLQLSTQYSPSCPIYGDR